MVTATKTTIIKSAGSIISHLIFIQLSKRLIRHIEIDLDYVELILVKKTMVHTTQVIILH